MSLSWIIAFYLLEHSYVYTCICILHQAVVRVDAYDSLPQRRDDRTDVMAIKRVLYLDALFFFFFLRRGIYERERCVNFFLLSIVEEKPRNGSLEHLYLVES